MPTTKTPARKSRSKKLPPDNTAPPTDTAADERLAQASPHLWMRDRFLRAPETRNVIHGQGRFWHYANGIWREIPPAKIRKQIAVLAADEKNHWFQATSGSIASVVDMVRDHQFIADERFDNNPDIIVFNDCVLDLNTFEKKPHDHRYYATSKLPFDYNPDAVCPAWAKWGERIDRDVLLYLEEYGGLCLTTDQRFEKMLWLVGLPNCGKGTYIQALCAALGTSRWTTLSSSDIGNRFGLVNLAGKTLAFASESPPIKTANCIDVVDRIVSGEPIRVEQKGQPGYDLTPRCKVVCAMNVKPAVNNADSGLFRRTDIVPMPPLNVAIDPSVKTEIVNNGQAMVNVFLAGLRRLRERGHFDVPLPVQIASAEFRAENDHVALFLEDKYTPTPGHKMKSGELYDDYKEWCTDNGFRNPLDSKKLRAELERLGAVYSRSNGSWYEGFKRQ
jgi:P4 family phage/plasmid primase-like protien